MSSRQEEKERRRLERIERERAEAAAAKRKRLAMVVGGALVAVVALVVVVLALSSGDSDTSTGPSADASSTAAIPARKVTNLQQAVKAAGCKLGSFPEESREHIADNDTFDGYKTNPPTSGMHHNTPAQDGVYDAGNEPAKESWVHTLEHGRIILQYKPNTPKRVVAQLQTLFNEQVKGAPSGYHMVLLQNNTKMPFQIAAVGWRHYVGCNKVDDKTWDALRAFRDTYVDTAPEQVP